MPSVGGMTDNGTRRHQPLDQQTILAATEKVLRRHGPAKATVSDVARELGVSNASVYRYFPSKAALREAVARRWLTSSHGDLAKIADDRDTEAPPRLRQWLATLFDAVRRQAADDPELFATFLILVRYESRVADDHVNELLGQLERIVTDGIEEGSFIPVDARATARAIFHAVTRFHHPALAPSWFKRPDIDTEFDEVRELVLRSLTAAV